MDLIRSNWLLLAVLSAFFAALTTIFAKIGVRDVPSNLATAIRTDRDPVPGLGHRVCHR